MSQLEWRSVDSEEFIRELGEAVSQHRENKYAFQVGLRNIDFEIDQDQASVLGVALPFNSIEQAERALRKRVIRPAMLLEEDETEHQVAVFDPEPVGFSGFMRCVTHSLVLTDQGLFEVGRFQAMSLINQSRYWQWFLHRRLATLEQATYWKEHHNLSGPQVVERFFEAITGISR